MFSPDFCHSLDGEFLPVFFPRSVRGVSAFDGVKARKDSGRDRRCGERIERKSNSRPVSAQNAESRTGQPCRIDLCRDGYSFFDEFQQIGIDLVRVGGGHAVREPGICFQGSVLQKFDGAGAGSWEGTDLIVLAMHHQNGHVDDLQIVVELGFREDLDAVLLSLDAAHHSLTPPVVPDAL